MNREMKDTYRTTGKKTASSGKIGDKSGKKSGYESSDWSKVDAMVTGKHPTTNLCTNRVAGK